MFASLKISLKLTALIALLLVAMVTVGAFGAFSLRGAQERTAVSLQQGHDLLQAVDEARQAEVGFKVQIQEFKNILLRGHVQADYDKYLSDFNKQTGSIHKQLADVKAAMLKFGLPATPVDEAVALHGGIVRAYLDGLKQYDVAKSETSQAVDTVVRGKDRPLAQKIEAIVEVLQKHATQESARIAEASSAESARVIGVFTLLIGMAVIAAIFGGVLVTRSITGPIGEAVVAARRVADGDLTVKIQARGTDETGQLLKALADMTDNLRTLVGEVAGGAHTVSDTSAQIAQGNVDLSQRTEEQASTLEETASSMEELTSTVTQNAENARQASQLAVGASEVARKGGQVVGQVVSTMTGISESSRKISDIISVIDGIAFQTNILALNAAVEAARAGEQGRGFAVVAAEVRNLAQRSAAAAKEIKMLIGDSVDKVDAGTRLVDAAGKTMEEIVTSVNKVSNLVAEIAAASQEQSSGIEQVNTAVTQMDQVVQQNASLVEEATAATESMKEQAASLLQTVARFKLGNDQGTVASVHASAPRRGAPSMAAPEPIRVRSKSKTALPASFAAALGAPHAKGTPNGEWKEF